MKKKIHFLIVILIFTVLFQSLNAGRIGNADNADNKVINQQIKTEIEVKEKDSLKDENSQKDEIQFIRTPFSILLDDKNRAVKIKINPSESIKLTIKNMDPSENGDGKIEIISSKAGKILDDENLSAKKIEKEYNGIQSDEVTLISNGRFLVKSSNLEVIADMEFNIPQENSSDDTVVAADKNIIETEVVSAADKQAFEKATNIQKTDIDKIHDNKILLVHDDNADKEIFIAEVAKEAKNSGVIENSKINKPSETEEILQNSKPLQADIKELDDVDKDLVAKSNPKTEVKKSDENIKSSKPSLQNIEKIAQNDKKFDNNDIEKDSEKIKDNLISKDEKFQETKPQIPLNKIKNEVKDADKATNSLQEKIATNDKDIKNPDTPSFSPPKISDSIDIKTPPVVLASSSGMPVLKPSLLRKDMNKIADEAAGDQDNIKDTKPKIESKSDEEIKGKISADEIIQKLPKSREVDTKKPMMDSNEPLLTSPSTNKNLTVTDDNIKIDNKPVIKTDNEKLTKAPDKESIILPEKISKNIHSSKPVISNKESISAPSFEETVKKKSEKILPQENTLSKGVLQVYVVKDNSPIVGWIDIIDEKTDKIVANGDTFFKNPVSFTIPSGKYTIVVTDKKVVPPIQEKIYSVEVLPNQTVKKTTTFVQGIVKINVTKNLIPTSSAFVKIYDSKTRKKVIDDNTYKNNPVVAKLPLGNYYIEIEDYSIVPKQYKRIENVIVKDGEPVVKSIDFQEGSLVLNTMINDNPIASRYDIYPAGDTKKIKSSNTDINSGQAKLKLAAGDYDIKVYNNSCVIKSVKTFKNVHVQKESLTELDINFEEGKLKVLSVRGLKPLYTNVSIYRYNTNERIYFDFTSRDEGEAVMKLPVGVYTVLVRDHNIKRKFPKVIIKENKTTKIHAKF